MNEYKPTSPLLQFIGEQFDHDMRQRWITRGLAFLFVGNLGLTLMLAGVLWLSIRAAPYSCL